MDKREPRLANACIKAEIMGLQRAQDELDEAKERLEGQMRELEQKWCDDFPGLCFECCKPIPNHVNQFLCSDCNKERQDEAPPE